MLDSPAAATVQSVADEARPDGGTIALTPTEYWQLRAAVRDVEALELQFIVAREDLTKRIREATERRERLFAALAQKYDLKTTAKYQCDDPSCSLREAL